MSESRLKDALEEIRLCRNNMSKEDFLRAVYWFTRDNNVLVPLIELGSVCTVKRIEINAKRGEQNV